MAVPHLSHLVSLASPQMSTPTALRGPCGWGDKAGVPAANGATSLVASCWLTPKLWGPHSQFLTVINTSTSVCVCVWVCGWVGGWVGVAVSLGVGASCLSVSPYLCDYHCWLFGSLGSCSAQQMKWELQLALTCVRTILWTNFENRVEPCWCFSLVFWPFSRQWQ